MEANMLILAVLFGYLLPLDSPMMENMDYLFIKGFLRYSLIKPYDITELMPQFDELVAGEYFYDRTDSRMISRFNRLLVKRNDYTCLVQFNSNYDRETGSCFYFDEMMGGRIISNLSWNQAIRFRFAGEIDSLGPNPWKDAAQAYLREGNLYLDTDRFKALFGRRNYLLGPGDDYGLLLSPAKEGYDGLMIRIPAKYYEFYTLFSILDAFDRRYLSVHRLGLDLKNFTLGFSESILFTHDLEPLYLNFLLPYYLSQWGLDRDDNIMWNLDIGIRAFNTYCYGELLIDDYMYEDDPHPSKLAYQVGFRSLIARSFLIKGNYGFVDKWVYTHEDAWNTYENNGMPLGFPLGNDCDRLSGSVSFIHWLGITPSVMVNFTRQGEGSIYLPYETEGGNWNPPFPSGVVQKTLGVTFSAEYSVQGIVFVKAGVGKEFVTNQDHVPGNDTDDVTLNASLWLVY